MSNKNNDHNITNLCNYMNISRQAFYCSQKSKFKTMLQEGLILELVMNTRRKMPRIGARKLFSIIKNDLENLNIKIGRDKFFELLKMNDLLVKKRKNYTKTTNSYHRFRVYKNLIKDLEIIRSNQVWQSDITYIRTKKGFCYLSLITDAFSRKIVGYDISKSLSIEGSKKAIEMALKQKNLSQKTIHHSDRGIQYCSNIYTDILKKNDIEISMTEINHCYENALAERVNGILKDEFYLNSTFKNFEIAKKTIVESIGIYNSKRPHWSLNLRTPNSVHNTA